MLERKQFEKFKKKRILFGSKNEASVAAAQTVVPWVATKGSKSDSKASCRNKHVYSLVYKSVLVPIAHEYEGVIFPPAFKNIIYTETPVCILLKRKGVWVIVAGCLFY